MRFKVSWVDALEPPANSTESASVSVLNAVVGSFSPKVSATPSNLFNGNIVYYNTI